VNYARLMSVMLTGFDFHTLDMASTKVVSCVDWQVFLQFKLLANSCSLGLRFGIWY